MLDILLPVANKTEKKQDNVPGVFYVDSQCVDCDLCRQAAPSNFRRNDQANYSYVYKQPETPEEFKSCEAAINDCPVQAIGNDG